MANPAEVELINSVRQLYISPDYSDLTIASATREYPVHKAVVCPRSGYFAEECRNPESEVFRDGVLNLREDDPQAVDMVVQYLYNLDYPSVPADEVVDRSEHQVNGTPASPVTNGNGVHSVDPEAQSEVPAEIESLDDIASMPKPKTGGKKKKKRKKAVGEATAGESAPATNGIPAGETAVELEPEPAAEPVADAEPDAAVDDWLAGDQAVTPTAEDTSKQNSVVIHARVHALSSKYRIAGLRDLTLNKFKVVAWQEWSTKEFLRAIKEIYAWKTNDEVREWKDVVVQILSEHLELVDKEETQETMRGLEVSTDLLIYMRKRGSNVWI